jgi:hypothetical protein
MKLRTCVTRRPSPAVERTELAVPLDCPTTRIW